MNQGPVDDRDDKGEHRAYRVQQPVEIVDVSCV